MEEQTFRETALDQDQNIDQERRAFLKKVLIGTIFAVPVVNSFSMQEFKPRVPNAWGGS